MWGWLGIVIGLLCCGILGVVFGVLSLRDAERYGNSKTLGYIAVVASLVNVLAGAVWGLAVND